MRRFAGDVSRNPQGTIRDHEFVSRNPSFGFVVGLGLGLGCQKTTWGHIISAGPVPAKEGFCDVGYGADYCRKQQSSGVSRKPAGPSSRLSSCSVCSRTPRPTLMRRVSTLAI